MPIDEQIVTLTSLHLDCKLAFSLLGDGWLWFSVWTSVDVQVVFRLISFMRDLEGKTHAFPSKCTCFLGQIDVYLKTYVSSNSFCCFRIETGLWTDPVSCTFMIGSKLSPETLGVIQVFSHLHCWVPGCWKCAGLLFVHERYCPLVHLDSILCYDVGEKQPKMRHEHGCPLMQDVWSVPNIWIMMFTSFIPLNFYRYFSGCLFNLGCFVAVNLNYVSCEDMFSSNCSEPVSLSDPKFSCYWKSGRCTR